MEYANVFIKTYCKRLILYILWVRKKSHTGASPPLSDGKLLSIRSKDGVGVICLKSMFNLIKEVLMEYYLIEAIAFGIITPKEAEELYDYGNIVEQDV